MDRRRSLGACAYLAGALAGRAARRDGSGSDGDRGGGTDGRAAGAAAEGRDTGGDGATADGLPAPTSEPVRGAPKDAIPAIVNPEFGDDRTGERVGIELATDPLTEDDRVIGVVRGDEARAYPLRATTTRSSTTRSTGRS